MSRMMKRPHIFMIAVLLVTFIPPVFGQASEPFLGQLMIVPYNFAPKGWANCSGQLMSISQNTALFSLLGTTYGGNGTTNFALPNLNGSIAIGAGQGPGLSLYELGQTGGESAVTLTVNGIPAHGHQIYADTAKGTTASPAGGFPAANIAGVPQYSGSAGALMNGGALSVAGGSQPHNNMMPYLGLKFIIALQGVYPARPAADPTKSVPRDQNQEKR